MLNFKINNAEQVLILITELIINNKQSIFDNKKLVNKLVFNNN